MEDTKNLERLITEQREKASGRLLNLYEELERIRNTELSLAKCLPPIIIEIKLARSTSIFRIVHHRSEGYFKIFINERIFGLNSMKRILAAFRHNLVHVYQLSIEQRMSHTQKFVELEQELDGMDDDLLRRPEPKMLRLIYVCPNHCQEFRSEDSVSIICHHCGSRMRGLGPEAYRRYDVQRKDKARRHLEIIQKQRSTENEER